MKTENFAHAVKLKGRSGFVHELELQINYKENGDGNTDDEFVNTLFETTAELTQHERRNVIEMLRERLERHVDSFLLGRKKKVICFKQKCVYKADEFHDDLLHFAYLSSKTLNV